MEEGRDRHLRSLQGSVNMLDAKDAVMRASIDQLAAMIRDLSARLDQLEFAADRGQVLDARERGEASPSDINEFR